MARTNYDVVDAAMFSDGSREMPMRQLSPNQPCHPDYKNIESRVQSFKKDWPYNTERSPQKMAEAGLFSSNSKKCIDEVWCHQCGARIWNWEPDDNPLVEHVKFAKKQCAFLHQLLGDAEIEEILKSLNQEIVGLIILSGFVFLNHSQPFDGFFILPPDPAVLALFAACENQFICEIDPIIGTGCINKTFICDGIPDCSDGTDEDNCTLTCGDGQYKCLGPAQRCISSSQFCDGTSDCPNNDDESQCKSTCPGNMLTFSNGNCVQANKVCDGSRDCPDNGDENSCEQRGCPGNQFTCTNGNCVNATQICDSTNNCGNNEDEAFCPARGCPPNFFACNNGNCIPRNQVCDGNKHCQNNEDEDFCPRPGCSPNQFTCSDGSCINANVLCNSQRDCADGADEFNCVLPVPPVAEMMVE